MGTVEFIDEKRAWADCKLFWPFAVRVSILGFSHVAYIGSRYRLKLLCYVSSFINFTNSMF